MKLTEAFKTVGIKLQEQATELSHSDICARLRDALQDIGRDSNQYYYVVDIFGDDQSGDVVYSCGGDLMKAPYEFSQVNGKQVAAINVDQAVDVVPRTTYEEEADEEDHYATMEADFKTEGLYTELPLYERFISKSERDAAGSEDFAGKGKSFPILKPGDIMAAVRSMGRAGASNLGPSSIKAKIIAIAKRKGWTKYLPKAWQSSSSSESAVTTPSSGLRLIEAAATLETIRLVEAKADYEIKLIAPGKGSSAFYPKEVLQRDGPKIFKAGTHVYLNHPTAAEEAARPEGDVANLAGVLSTSAEWKESHAKGPGLYARMKVFADHGQMVEEKAPHVGMSIRASGVAESSQRRDGLPVLKELTSAESVDIVTRAGAGGLVLTESATRRSQSEQEADEMTAEEIKRLVEAETRPYRERLLKADAREMGLRILESVALPDRTKRRVVETVVSALDASQPLNETKLTEAINAAAKEEGEYLASVTGSGRVIGMGAAAAVKPKELKEAKKRAKEERRDSVDVFESLMGDRKAAKLAVTGRGA